MNLIKKFKHGKTYTIKEILKKLNKDTIKAKKIFDDLKVAGIFFEVMGGYKLKV